MIRLIIHNIYNVKDYSYTLQGQKIKCNINNLIALVIEKIPLDYLMINCYKLFKVFVYMPLIFFFKLMWKVES